MSNFNPRSPCGERLPELHTDTRNNVFSIHAPRAGSDPCAPVAPVGSPISIHAPPCGERRKLLLPAIAIYQFQSTLPVRGATRYRYARRALSYIISIHAPRAGERPRLLSASARLQRISIHAPRAGSGRLAASVDKGSGKFQSTLPVRGATHCPSVVPYQGKLFQSTLPVRGATGKKVK